MPPGAFATIAGFPGAEPPAPRSFHPMPVILQSPSPLSTGDIESVRSLFGSATYEMRALQLAFAVLVAEFEKIEGVFVSDRQLGLRAQGRRQRLVEIGLAQE